MKEGGLSALTETEDFYPENSGIIREIRESTKEIKPTVKIYGAGTAEGEQQACPAPASKQQALQGSQKAMNTGMLKAGTELLLASGGI